MCFRSPPTGCLFACSPPLHHFMFQFKCHFLRLPLAPWRCSFCYLRFSPSSASPQPTPSPAKAHRSWEPGSHCTDCRLLNRLESLFQEAGVAWASSRQLSCFPLLLGDSTWLFLLGRLADLPFPGSSKGLPGASDYPEVSLSSPYSLHTLEKGGGQVLGLSEVTELFNF